jgi:HK97 family phage portal protein
MPSLLSRLKVFVNRTGSGVLGLWQRWGGMGVGGWARFLLPGSRYDYDREAGDLWANSVVAIALRWLGDRFPRPVLRLYRVTINGDQRPVYVHRVLSRWNRPNDFYTRRTLEKAIGLSLVVDGNAYVYKQRSGSGEVIGLWWLPHYAVFPRYPSDGSEYLSGWDVLIDSVTYPLPASDVIHFRDGIDPRNDRLGLAPLKSQIREVCTVNEESGYTASILRNAGVPSLVVSPEPGVSAAAPAMEIIKGKIKDLTSGESRGEPLVVTAPIKIQAPGFSPEQLRLDKLPANAVARIAASIGVASMSLGLPDPNKTYSNLAEANATSWGTIQALQELICETLLWQLLVEYEDPNKFALAYDYSAIPELQEDANARSTRITNEWKSGLLQLNEARELLSYEPDVDGDRFFPGTGSPEDMERATAMAEMTQPKDLGQDGGPPVDDNEGDATKAASAAMANGHHDGRWSY